MDVSKLDSEEGWYHLPRSSLVISCKTRFHVNRRVEAEQSLEQSNCVTPSAKAEPSKAFWNMQGLPEKTTLYSQKQVEKCSTCEGVSYCSSWSFCQSTHEIKSRDLSPSEGVNAGTEPGNKTMACPDGHLSSGPINEQKTSEDFYRINMELDQENAHFVVVDMVLEVLEALKWTYCQQHQHTDTIEDKDTLFHSQSFSSQDSGYEDWCDYRFPASSSFQTSARSSLRDSGCSAEDLAQQLLMDLRKQWLSSEQPSSCDKQCLALEEMRFSLDAVSTVMGDRISLSEEIIQRSRMRGTLTWAPPRFQIIFSVQPTQRRSDIIAYQHFLCAGCGTEVEPRYIKRLRYCDYLGRYFCDGCHGGADSTIPGRVLCHWDFSRYPVCSFSKHILDSIWEQPLFKLDRVAKGLYTQARELQRFRELQDQLISIKKLLRTCRLSDRVLAEFQQLPAHLSEEPHLFSMSDLVRVKRGHLLNTAKAVLRSAIGHVEDCELCQANGFICEFCHGQDIIFPFQTDICTRCQECRACFHSACFKDLPCPKCARLQTRKSLQNNPSF